MKILIIKIEALGCVIRTTCVLRPLEGDITWFTKKKTSEFLKGVEKINRLVTDVSEIEGEEFDIIYSLDDSRKTLEVLKKVKGKKILGFYEEEGVMTCTEGAREYYNMSLQGGEDRDLLKKRNKKTYQEMIFNIMEKEFKGERPMVGFKSKEGNCIGIDNNIGVRWKLKQWDKFDQLKERLEKDGYEVIMLSDRNTFEEFVDDINKCKIVVGKDSMPMHLATALNKKVVAIFGPTSANEIHDYDGQIIKVQTPLDCKVCMKPECNKKPNCMNEIPVDEVYNAVKKHLTSEP